MSFLNTSCTFSRFNILDEVDNNFWNDFTHNLQKHAFEEIETLAKERAFGWTNFDDMFDIEWKKSTPNKAEYVCFSLRLDTRRIAPAIYKKHLQFATEKELSTGRTYISKERKAEIKEQTKIMLLTKTLPTPAEFQVIWNIKTNVIFFASNQSKMIDLFTEYFLKSFSLHLELITPYSFALNILGSEKEYKLDNFNQTRFI